MNQKQFAATVSALRKKRGLTQSALARQLNVSDKAVSKWETGLGYPEITLLPKLASILGVTVDYLMTGQRRGIAVAGMIVNDIVKSIDLYPQRGMLANIMSIRRAVGGCVPNTAVDLARMDQSLPVCVAGCVGDDEAGRYVLTQLQHNNIDTTRITITDAATNFTDVMSLPNGERTFFYYADGANALFDPQSMDISSLNCTMLHMGYLLAMPRFDAPDPEYGTVMARFLKDVQSCGIKTSFDVVSAAQGEYPVKIIPALKYTDNVIVNEIECCNIWACDPRRPDGALDVTVLRDAMERTMAQGVSERVIIHSKEAGFCLNREGEFTVVPSLEIPDHEIKGSVGAGDAFCAGCLYGIYHNWTDREILEFASASAACNLFAENSVDGARSKDEIFAVKSRYARKRIP